MDLQFNMQRSTIITWSNSLNNEDDKAISFQDIEGVKEVWEIICHIQGRNRYDIINALCCDNNEVILPDVTIENLSMIDSIIRNTHTDSKGNNNSNNESNLIRLKQINSEVMTNAYEFLYKLGLLFNEEEKKAEELRSNCSNKTASSSDIAYPNNDNLTYISSIIKHLLLIADKELLFTLCTDKYYEFIFGALEFDCVVLKAIRHRDYFKSIANFRNILEINDAELIMKIHLNHRLAYLRDTAAGRFIEETTFNNINLIIQANNSNIIRFFITNEKLITIILDKLNCNNQSNDYQTQRDAIAFLLELINCSQNSFQLRIQFLEIVCSLGILNTIESLIISLKANLNTQWFNIMNSNISQILINLLSFVPSQFKSHIISNINDNNSTLLTAITQLLSEHNDYCIQYEIGEIIKTLLDNNLIHNSIYSGSLCQSNDNTATIFFNMILNNCLLPLSELLTVDISTENRNQCITAKQITIEVLAYCIAQHCKPASYWFIENNILLKVLSVLRDNFRILDLQVVKFVNRLILNNDDCLNEEVIKTNALSKMIALFANNIKAKNIIVSAILNLLQTIKSITSSSKLFISHLFRDNKDILYNKAYHSYFKELIDLYEASIESNKDPMSFDGLFPLNNEKNDEDDFDLDENKGQLLAKKTHRDIDNDH